MRFASTPLALSLVAIAAACSSIGCSDPVPATQSGAWFVNLEGGPDCTITGGQTKVGDVNDHEDQALIDNAGPEGATLDCTVAPAGSGFTVDASMLLAPDDLLIHIDSIDKSATMDAPATGSIAYSSDKTSEQAYIAPSGSTMTPPCNFFFVPNTSEGIDAGKVWLAFQCDVTDKSIAMPSTCNIFQGYAIFENCHDGSGN